MIHDRVDSEASRLVRIVGSATLTMVVSSRAMNIPASRTTSARHTRGETVVGGGPSRPARAAGAAVCSVMESVLRCACGWCGGGQRVRVQRSGTLVGDDVGQRRDEVPVPLEFCSEAVLAMQQGVGLGHGEVRAGPFVRLRGLA